MSTPLSTPVKQAKLRLVSGRAQPLVADFKKLLGEQHQRLWAKHQQDLELIEDVRSYAKARLSIERQYTASLSKLAKQHSAHIAKKFQLLPAGVNVTEATKEDKKTPVRGGGEQVLGEKGDSSQLLNESEASDSRLQKRLAHQGGLDEPEEPTSLYAVWSEHSQRLAACAKNRSEQFDQLVMVVDKLKDVKARKASIGKKCLDTHLKRVHEDILMSMLELEKAKKLYYEDESQAKKAREHEEKIKKKRSGLMSKFTGQDLQAKKERTSARREANDIQSTQARNDYIMALAAANAHLEHYFQKDLNDFMLLIDDGLLDHCKISMATLSECDINSLKESLSNAKYWSKMINLTGSQRTNSIFLESPQSTCLRDSVSLPFEPCNEDPIRCISLEHNADYALQHEIDKWLTWFKKECRNLGQLVHNLELCQRAFGEGKKSIEIGGQSVDDLESRIVELKQLIRKSEAAKQKAQARLKVIKEGGMQIEEWSVIEAEIQASAAAKAQQQLEEEMRRSKEMRQAEESGEQSSGYLLETGISHHQVKLQLSQDSDGYDSVHNLASISRSPSNVTQQQHKPTQQPKQPQQVAYAALADPAAAWQDDYSSPWGGSSAQQQGSNYNLVVTPETYHNDLNKLGNNDLSTLAANRSEDPTKEFLNTSGAGNQLKGTSMTVQSSSPLSAVVDAIPPSTSPYPILGGEAYKSDYECDYNRNHHIRSTMSSAEMSTGVDHYKRPISYGQTDSQADAQNNGEPDALQDANESIDQGEVAFGLESTYELINRQVVTLYDFDKTNEDDLSFKENEVLLILEVNDENWFKARNMETGEEGYIPAPYVRVLEDRPGVVEESYQQVRQEEEVSNERQPAMDQATTDQSLDRSSVWNTQDIQNEDEVYFQAIYDYQPERSFDELDGLPHLVLRQSEVMRVIEKGVDGWWLVEREGSGERGHVPSMLVEEIGGGEEDEEENLDNGEDGDSFRSNDELDDSVMALPPSFEPPPLEAPTHDQPAHETIQQSSIDRSTDEPEQPNKITPTSNNLTATSFIIIEPTPEVECRNLDDEEDAIAKERIDTANSSSSGVLERGMRETVVVKNVPPASTSYCIVNEDFVLEKPTRRPSHHHPEQIPHHETPTIPEEENEVDTTTKEESRRPVAESTRFSIEEEEEDNEKDPPPCVIIDTCEDKARDDEDDTFSLEDDSQDSKEPCGSVSSGEPSSNHILQQRANVDVNPILRYRAEQFSKQIIEEALELIQEASFDRQIQPPQPDLRNHQNYYV